MVLLWFSTQKKIADQPGISSSVCCSDLLLWEREMPTQAFNNSFVSPGSENRAQTTAAVSSVFHSLNPTTLWVVRYAKQLDPNKEVLNTEPCCTPQWDVGRSSLHVSAPLYPSLSLHLLHIHFYSYSWVQPRSIQSFWLKDRFLIKVGRVGSGGANGIWGFIYFHKLLTMSMRHVFNLGCTTAGHSIFL